MTQSSQAARYLDSLKTQISNARQQANTAIKDEIFEEGALYAESLRAINTSEMVAGQARLIVMWWLFQNIELVGEHNDFDDFMENAILAKPSIDTDRIRRSKNVIQGIIVWAQGNPVQVGDDLVNGDALVNKEGLVSKLTNVNGIFHVLPDSMRARLIEGVWTLNQEALAELRRTLREELTSESPDPLGNLEGGLLDDVDPEDRQDRTGGVVVIRKMFMPNGKVQMEFTGDLSIQLATSIEAVLDGLAQFEVVAIQE